MGWLSSIFQLITAIPSLIKTFNEVMAWVDKWNRDNAAKKASQAVDNTTSTGDQRLEEQVTGGTGGLPTKIQEPGLGERPVKSRS